MSIYYLVLLFIWVLPLLPTFIYLTILIITFKRSDRNNKNLIPNSLKLLYSTGDFCIVNNLNKNSINKRISYYFIVFSLILFIFSFVEIKFICNSPIVADFNIRNWVIEFKEVVIKGIPKSHYSVIYTYKYTKYKAKNFILILSHTSYPPSVLMSKTNLLLLPKLQWVSLRSLKSITILHRYNISNKQILSSMYSLGFHSVFNWKNGKGIFKSIVQKVLKLSIKFLSN